MNNKTSNKYKNHIFIAAIILVLYNHDNVSTVYL